MKNIAITALACATAALGACAPAEPVTRGDSAPLRFHQQTQAAALPIQQATALSLQTRKIMQTSTRRGAIVTAAIGCGQTKGIAGKRQCLHTATVRTSRVNAQPDTSGGSTDLTHDIRSIEAQLTALTKGLPPHLAAQDARVKRDRTALKDGQITKAAFLQRYDIMRRDRVALAEALTRAEKQMRTAKRNLIKAGAKGDRGRAEDVTRMGKIATRIDTARRMIPLK